MRFKYDYLESEYQSDKLSGRLRLVLEALETYMNRTFAHEIVITRIFEDLGNPKSQHLVGEAADVRANDWKPDEVGNACTYLNSKHYRMDKVGGRNALTCWAHGTGGDFHLHISVDKRKS